MENKNNELGALWIKQNDKGEFFTGKITLDNGEEIKVVVFKNTYKSKDNQPDYKILKAREKQQQNETEAEIIDDIFLPF